MEESTTDTKQPTAFRRIAIKFVCAMIACIAAHALLDAFVGSERLKEIPFGEGLGTGIGIAIGLIVGDYLAHKTA